MALQFTDILLLLGAVQGFFLTALLFQKSRRLFADRFLVVMMLLYSVILVNLLFSEIGIYQSTPHLMLLTTSFPFLIGPLHFLYAKYLIGGNIKIEKTDWLHFLPFVLFLLYSVAGFLRSGAEIMAAQPDFERLIIPAEYLIVNWLLSIQGLVYMLLTVLLLRRYSKSLESFFSSIEKIRLDWLRILTMIVLACWLIFFAENTLLSAGINLSGFDLSSVLLAVAVYTVGYFGLLKTDPFLQPQFVDAMHRLPEIQPEMPAENDGSSRKYQKSGLSEDRAKRILADLLALMEAGKAYTRSDLTLADIAEQLSVTPHNLSEVINTQLNQNFFDFINHYRVEAVKKDLSDPQKQHLTILAIALDAGFNSKTAFNTIFKKHTGTTPSAFRNLPN